MLFKIATISLERTSYRKLGFVSLDQVHFPNPSIYSGFCVWNYKLKLKVVLAQFICSTCVIFNT